MGKSKKQLRRALRECREHLDEVLETLDEMAERDPVAHGICEPVPEFMPVMRAERGSIRFATPGLCADEREQAKGLELKLQDRERQLRAERATVARQARELADARRHLHHHHTEGAFTLVREVSGQVAAENTRLKRELAQERRRSSSLATERWEARAALAWHAEVWLAAEEGVAPDDCPGWERLIDAWRERQDPLDD